MFVNMHPESSISSSCEKTDFSIKYVFYVLLNYRKNDYISIFVADLGHTKGSQASSSQNGGFSRHCAHSIAQVVRTMTAMLDIFSV